MLLNNEKNDVKVGLDYSTAIAILQIKCATLVHVSVPERLQETLVHVSVLNVSCKRSGIGNLKMVGPKKQDFCNVVTRFQGFHLIF